MNETWMKFLIASGGVIGDGAVSEFNDRDAELKAVVGNGVIVDLSHRGLIQARGEDAASFLQGQLTCDMDELGLSRSLLGAWCSPKGRVLTLVRLLLKDKTILMELPCERLRPTLERLRMYILRARVELKDVSDEFVQFGIFGDAAGSLISEEFGEKPGKPDEVLQQEGVRIVRLGSGPRFEAFFDDVDAAKAFWHRASQSLMPAGVYVWDLLDILDGLPRLPEADEFLPQMLNLDRLGGISFTKGCYVGQEVIARTHHLGRLKRRMFRLGFDSDSPPADNTPLFREGSGDEGDGRLLFARRQPDGGYAGLAVIKVDSVGERLQLGAENGLPVEIRPLPYGSPR